MNVKKIILLVSLAVVLFILNLVLSSLKKEEVPTLSKMENMYDEKVFFDIQEAINEFVSNTDSLDDSEIIKYLNPKYVSDNGITDANLSSKMVLYNDASYSAKSMFKKTLDDTTYYFVNGYIIINNENAAYYNNINYLVTVNGNTYNLYPLEANSNIDSFDKFDVNGITADNGMFLNSLNYTEKNKLISYIAEFVNLMNVDVNYAYELLSETEKSKYYSVNDFYNNYLDKYSDLSIMVSYYNKSESGGNTIYDITNEDNVKIKITEQNVMNYKIEFN